MLNHHLFQNLKLKENGKFNHLIFIQTDCINDNDSAFVKQPQ
jgi:hypothetical protein